RGIQSGCLVLGDDHCQRTGGISSSQTGAQVVGIGHTVEDQQQRRTLGTIQQLFEHRITPDLTGTDIRHDALVHTFDPGIQLTPLTLPDTNPRLLRQLNQRLNPRIAAPLSQPNLLDPLGAVAKQRLYSVQAVDLFQIAHDLPLRSLAAPLSDRPEGSGLLPVLDLCPLRLDFSPSGLAVLASPSRAFFISRLLRTSPLTVLFSAGPFRSRPALRSLPASADSRSPMPVLLPPLISSKSILRSSRSTRITRTSTLSPRRKLRPLRSPERR